MSSKKPSSDGCGNVKLCRQRQESGEKLTGDISERTGSLRGRRRRGSGRPGDNVVSSGYGKTGVVLRTQQITQSLVSIDSSGRSNSGKIRRRSAPPGSYSSKMEADINNRNMQ